MERLLYYFSHKLIRQSTEVPVDPECNSWTAVNQGSDIVVVEGIQLLPSSSPTTITGDSVSIEGNKGEIYSKKTIKVVFQSLTGPKLLIVQKCYSQHYK